MASVTQSFEERSENELLALDYASSEPSRSVNGVPAEGNNCSGMGIEHNSAQNSLGEEFQGHHTNQAYYKSGIMSLTILELDDRQNFQDDI